MMPHDLGQRGVHAVKNKVSFINPKGKYFESFPVPLTKQVQCDSRKLAVNYRYIRQVH